MSRSCSNDTDRVVRDAEFAPGHLAQVFRTTHPAGRKLTPAQARVLAQVDGLSLPFVGHVLLYARELERLRAVGHRIVFALVRGGHLRLYQVSGPQPGEHPAHAVGARASYHYVLASQPPADCAGGLLTPNADVVRYTVHGVLAGAYRGGRAQLLSHVLLAGADHSLCGRIDVGHLSDLDTLYERADAYGPVPGAPSCPMCATRLEKLASTTDLVRDPDIGA